MTDINQLVAEIRQATDFQKNKKILREKIQTDLHLAYNGGLFKLSHELPAFVATWPNDELYIEDCYETPVKVDKQQFLIAAREQYQLVMNRWHSEYEHVKQQRKI